MKILVVIPDWKLGGVTTSAKNFCSECVSRNNNVDLIILDNTTANIKGVNQIFIDGLSKYWNLSVNDFIKFGLLKKLKLLPLSIIKKILNKYGLWYQFIFRTLKINNNYDLVVAYRQCSPCYYFSINCIHASKRLAMIHGNLKFMGDISSWEKFLPKFDKIACVSNAVALDFKNKYSTINNKFCTIYNMFNIEQIRSKGSNICLYKIDKSQINIVTLTRHENNHKRVNRIIEICAMLKERGLNNFHWYIAGDGPDFEKNKILANTKKVTELITFCGAIDNPYSLLDKCDFSVLTSATEAYSMAVIESQILGKPVVVMEYPGVDEAVVDKHTGLVCGQDINDICDKLFNLITDKSLIYCLQHNLSNIQFSNERAYHQLLKAIS